MKFDTAILSWTMFGAIASVVTVGGCRPAEAPQFTPSPTVSALDDEAADDEERKLWHDLQRQIEADLLKRCGTPLAPIVFGDPKADRTRLQLGAVVFAARCQQCHGVNGDGQGIAAQYLSPKPRDYTKGIFKFTSTPYGAKPRRADILQTLRRGVTGTSMPSFADLSPEDLDAVADYVIFLSQRGELENEMMLMAQDDEEIDPPYVDEAVAGIRERWHEAQSQLVMPLTPMPAMTPETIAKGHELFLKRDVQQVPRRGRSRRLVRKSRRRQGRLGPQSRGRRPDFRHVPRRRTPDRHLPTDLFRHQRHADAGLRQGICQRAGQHLVPRPVHPRHGRTAAAQLAAARSADRQPVPAAPSPTETPTATACYRFLRKPSRGHRPTS